MKNKLAIFQHLFDNPWKLTNEIKRIITIPYNYFYFKITLGKFDKTWKIYGKPILQINRKSKIIIGKNLELRSSYSSNPLTPFTPVTISTRSEKSKLKIGNNFGMSGGSIVCQKEITIGNRVIIGANSIVCDTDFHPLNYLDRIKDINNGNSKKITIEDDVFIGTGSIILKGVKIGKGAVIGAYSVVTNDVAPNSIYAGNPAKFIKKIA